MDIEDAALRSRFTAWMKVVVKRAKIDYIRQITRHSNEISIEDERMAEKLVYEPSVGIVSLKTDFDFDNRTLSAAFRKLVPKRRRLLELLFVLNMTPDEVAEELHCSIQHVYNLRSLAIKELRSKLDNGESN